jgi:hypothetical protein
MIKVIKAIYGGKDVKDIIERRYILNNIIKVAVNNESFGGDPMFGVYKTLDIEIDHDGKLISYKANEGENYIYPQQKHKSRNTLIITSCNRIDQILFAIAVNKEVIKEDFNLVVADCSTPHLDSYNAINMHRGDDPYNLINDQNYNPNWTMIEDYVKTIPKIKEFKIIHVDPRMNKQVGEAYLIGLGVHAAALMGSKYAIKLTGVCHLKYDIFKKFNELVGESGVATWIRTGFNDLKSTRVFMGKPDELTIALVKAGFYEWIYEYDIVERKFEKIINKYMDNYNHMHIDERDIIVDEGIGRTDHREILTKNLEKHGLLNSKDPWIEKFLSGDIWQ